jgi:hypothetical protein
MDKSQLVTINRGEKLDFKEFSVQVIESEHGALIRGGRRRRPKFEEITKQWSGPIFRNQLRRRRKLSLLSHLRQIKVIIPKFLDIHALD